MRQLMHTESWKSHNVLKLREDVMHGSTKSKSPGSKDALGTTTTSPIDLDEASPPISRVASPRPPKSLSPKDNSIGKPPIKSQNLK